MRHFELWIEGDDLWGNGIQKARKVADIEGPDFDSALETYIDELPSKARNIWEYDDDEYLWKWAGRRAFDNEKAARTIYG